MDYLLFRSLKGEATADDEETVLAWRDSSADNESYYQELSRLLALTAAAYRPSEEEIGATPEGADLVRLTESAVPTPPSPSDALASFARASRWRWWLTGGLGAATVVVLAVLSLGRIETKPAELLGFGVDEFATGAGDLATVQLRDGSILRLAPESRVRLTGSPGEREVTLDGRAYFAVAKMEGRPFTVRTRAGEAIVLGTRFEAEARGEELRVMVVEGRVALAGRGGRVELRAGEMARAVEGAVSAPVKVPDTQRMLEWTGNFLVFQRTPIDEVAVEIERHLGFPVLVTGNDFAEHTVTAWFADPEPEDVIRVVCKVLAAKCSIENHKATIDLRDTTP